ncbi:MAG TPA: response regulator transcription factor [Thermoanaerobaculia bacterium]|nr:response regulator transcription factor [Thermoanaerobaculia bacterium]
MSRPDRDVEATPKRRILVVEDEPGLVLTLSDRLRSEGHEVEVATDGNAAFEAARAGSFDLVVLDIALPKRNGLDVCRDLRREGVDTPILMLTARAELTDKVVGLKLGADDYLTKPFEMMELLARVEALLRRSGRALAGPGAYAFGDVRVDFRKAEVHRAGEAVALSALEYKLLAYLIERRGIVLSRDELLDRVWGYDATPTTRTVDVHVASLRQKIEANPAKPRWILTVHGLGYRFDG